MRCLLVSTSAIETPAPRYGGMERCAHWLAMGLDVLGHEVKVLAKIGSTTPWLVGEGTNELEFVELARGLQGQFDIIIDFSHDKLVSRSFPNFPQINNHQVMVLQWHKNPVFISKAQRSHIGREDAPVIYYGLNVEEYPFYEGPRDDYLLYMGSWIAEKRVHWVAELAQRLNLPAKIAGVGWQPEYWPTLEAMKKVPGVEFVGDVGGQEKLELIQKAKCLVHPVGGFDWVEAGAIIVLESLMVGTPVIASDNGCLPEYIVDFQNGFICTSVDEMAAVMKFLPQVSPYACRLSVIDRFNKTRFAKEYEILAREVIEGKTW